MTEWSFLTNHARVLVCIAHDPGVRLRDIAKTLDITERSAYSIVTDLTASGYVVKLKDGRRNRYQIRPHLPLREAITQSQNLARKLAGRRGNQGAPVASPDDRADYDRGDSARRRWRRRAPSRRGVSVRTDPT
jgi:hypothetical protein